MIRWGVAAVLFLSGCRVPDPPAIDAPWTDGFERKQLGRDYRPTSPVYKIRDGALSATGAVNRPLWLRKPLPRDVVIDFDCWSNSKDGDIKVEIFGDGESMARDRGQYVSSGYVLIMGGWDNTKSIIARHSEHGIDIANKRNRVVREKRYHWRIVREGTALRWYVDDMDAPYLEYEDPAPLWGHDNKYFAFNNWESDTWFDNLRIAPLSRQAGSTP